MRFCRRSVLQLSMPSDLIRGGHGVRVKKTRQNNKPRLAAIDAEMRVPHLPNTDYSARANWCGRSSNAKRYTGIAGGQRWPVPLSRRLAADGGISADPAVDPGRGGACRYWLRPLEYRQQHPAFVSADLGSRL